jgi:hypothetical protein
MRKGRILALGLCLVLALASTASAISVVNIGTLVVNGSSFTITANQLGPGSYQIPNQDFSNSDFDATIGGSISTDPAMSLSHHLDNFTNAPMAVSLVIGPVGFVFPGPAKLFESNSGSMGDADFSGFVSIDPNPLVNSSYILNNFTETNLWQVNKGFASATAPGFTVPFGPYDLPVTFGAGPNNSFTEALGYIISSGDEVSMTLYSAYKPVPVPPTVILLGSGLIGLVGLRYRRKKS